MKLQPLLDRHLYMKPVRMYNCISSLSMVSIPAERNIPLYEKQENPRVVKKKRKPFKI